MKARWIAVILGLGLIILIAFQFIDFERQDKEGSKLPSETPPSPGSVKLTEWKAPILQTDSSLSPTDRKTIEYGRDLIAHSARYFGTNGSVVHISNNMNCQNCHLKAGTQPWANNFAVTFSNYPRVSTRSGKQQTLYDRINSCFQRSMNGKTLDTASKEMQAMYAYIKWLGTGIEKGEKPPGIGLPKLAFLDRAADPNNGKTVFINNCQSCHGKNGEGVKQLKSKEFLYPPLWGKDSYNDGAGMYRISNFASFVKNNMPYPATSHWSPTLTAEQAWDVAAFVNSQPRPHKDASKDYPDLTKKPFDDPFGPYVDSFSQEQHKYGPFAPIVAAQKKK